MKVECQKCHNKIDLPDEQLKTTGRVYLFPV